MAFDFSLLYNSPLNNIKLQVSNAQFMTSLQKYEALRTPIYYYTERMTRIYKI